MVVTVKTANRLINRSADYRYRRFQDWFYFKQSYAREYKKIQFVQNIRQDIDLAVRPSPRFLPIVKFSKKTKNYTLTYITRLST